MKHLKTYENLQDTPNVSYKDFLTVKYWRFAHSMTNNIFKINSLNSEEMITMNANEVKDIDWLDDDIMNKIIFNADDGRLIRPATEEEINQFDLRLKTINYNL